MNKCQMTFNGAGKHLVGLMSRKSSPNSAVIKLDSSIRLCRHSPLERLNALTFSIENNKTGEFSRGSSLIARIKNSGFYGSYVEGLKNLVSHIKKDVFKL